MMQSEFEDLTGITVKWEDYHNIIEPMYIAADLPKQEFVKIINLDYFNQRPFEPYMIMRQNVMYDSDRTWEPVRKMIANSRISALNDFYFLMDQIHEELDTEWRYDAVPAKSLKGDVYLDGCSNN